MAGKGYNDRLLASDVRSIALKEIREVLLDKKCEEYSRDFHNQVLLKLAGTVLPRLLEHGGEDGGTFKVEIVRYKDEHTKGND